MWSIHSKGMDNLFLKPLDNPASPIWYAKSNVGEKTLENLVNMAMMEAGVHKEEDNGGSKITNKSGRTTMITRMGENGVSAEVGMLLSGHKSKGAYQRYDQSVDARVRAAQRCISEEIQYDVALAEEKAKTKLQISGTDAGQMEDNPSSKILKVEDAARVSTLVSSDTSNLQMAVSCTTTAAASSLLTDGVREKEIVIVDQDKRQIMNFDQVKRQIMNCDPVSEGSKGDAGDGKSSVNQEDLSWMDDYDWEGDLELYKSERNVVVNPIHAFFGKIGALNNCNFSLPSME